MYMGTSPDSGLCSLTKRSQSKYVLPDTRLSGAGEISTVSLEIKYFPSKANKLLLGKGKPTSYRHINSGATLAAGLVP